MTKIDAHQHFWRIGRGDYGWLTPAEHPRICHDIMPDDLKPLLKAAGIDRTILVQAAPTSAETEFLLEVAKETTFVAGVVGWADLEEPVASEVIARMAARPKLVGLRPMIQDIADAEWMLRPAVSEAVDSMARVGLCFDALVKPRHLPALLQFLEHHPDLRLVIDHGAKPDIAHGEISSWKSYIRHIGRETPAFCKLSGLATEAGPGWTAETLKPWVDVLLDAFGPARLMWGSDWPVLNEAGDYPSWHDAACVLTASLSREDSDRIFGGTAAEFYGVAA